MVENHLGYAIMAALDSLILDAEINRLNTIVTSFQNKSPNEDITGEELLHAAQEAEIFFGHLLTAARNQGLRELTRFIGTAMGITWQLQNVTLNQAKRFASPNTVMYRLTSSFEGFVNATVSRGLQQRIRRATTVEPMIDGIITSCTDIPYYFHHANRISKIALIFSATIFLAILAFTIAMYATPALLAIPLLPLAISCFITIGRMFYDQVITSARKKYENKQKVETTLEKLGKLQVAMTDFAIKDTERIFEDKANEDVNVSDVRPKLKRD